MSELMNDEVFVTEEEAGFQVMDDQAAEWCLKKIREANQEKQRWEEYYDEQLRKIFNREDSRIAFMEEKLKAYFSSVPHKVTKTRESYQLPSGKLIWKHQDPEFERDDEKLLKWLYENNMRQYIKVKESVDWQELKKGIDFMELTEGPDPVEIIPVTEDGEVIPGITVTPRPDKFVVEVK